MIDSLEIAFGTIGIYFSGGIKLLCLGIDHKHYKKGT